ncbi:signal peptidase I [Streptomyces sp. NPDC002928]|uniref:signal peptidase I n=1 Tax=Streptomyces sp. NPDC002928 TaxID=3154440 RepID=UPI0033A8AB3D
MSGRGRGLGIAAVVVGLLGLVLTIGSFAYGREAYGAAIVSSASMTPTYEPGDRIAYKRVDGSEVRRGDVVMYSAPDRYGFDQPVMQRVIGVGGDHVVCCTGEGADARITVNGKPLAEPYVKGGDADGGMHKPYDVKVPKGRLFLLGDYRGNARDSRFFESDHDGTVSTAAVRGRVSDDYTALGVIGIGMIIGVVLVLTGGGLGIAAFVVRRRAAVSVPPPWPMQV